MLWGLVKGVRVCTDKRGTHGKYGYWPTDLYAPSGYKCERQSNIGFDVTLVRIAQVAFLTQ